MKSAALATETGVRVGLSQRVSARVGGKFVHVDETDYHALLGENLDYAVANLGFDFRPW